MSGKLYAVIRSPNAGYDSDVEKLERDILSQIPEDTPYWMYKIEVESIDIHSSSTDVYFTMFFGGFNSVQFEFLDEHGDEVDIFDKGVQNRFDDIINLYY